MSGAGRESQNIQGSVASGGGPARSATAGFQQSKAPQAATEQRERIMFYVDDQPAEGINSTRATVRHVLEKAGKDADSVDVYRVERPGGEGGRKLELDEEVEATRESPCYLRTEARVEAADEERPLEITDINAANPKRPEGVGQERRSGSSGSNPANPSPQR